LLLLLLLFKIKMLLGEDEDLICHQIIHHGNWTDFDKADLIYLSARVLLFFEF